MPAKRILIVEDEGISALDLQNRLTGMGYIAPDVVATGEEAVLKAEETRPDLILMDIMLKGEMDGVTAAGQILARFNIPVIFLTAYSDDATLQRAKITEPYGYLVKPLKDRDLHISIDIALYKHQAEEKIRELNEELKQSVVRLEASNKELESFSYAVAHDLRAPLRHVTGFVELLNERRPEGLDEKSMHYLNVISEAARHMGQLVDDLLSFSRMGRAELMHAPVDMNGLVNEAINDLRPEAKGRTIEWNISVLPAVSGDKAMLRLVFVNLISNALKFTGKRDRARIEIGHLSETNEEVFYVKDNGVGFDQKYVDKMFTLFQRLHCADEFAGTGVGLANVRRIIHRHRGRVWAEGAVGAGATIYFTLPKA